MTSQVSAPTDAEVLNALADRCEAASGADRFLDAQIAAIVRLERVPDWACTWSGEWRPNDTGSVVMMHADGTPGPHFMANTYTASLDAAMTLIGEGWEWSMTNTGSETFGPFMVSFGDPLTFRDVEARTLPLAICAAALRARAHHLLNQDQPS